MPRRIGLGALAYGMLFDRGFKRKKGSEFPQSPLVVLEYFGCGGRI